MGALKIIALALCVCVAAAAQAAGTNVLTKAEQKKLNRAGMKAAARLERTSGKFIEVPPVKAEASKLPRADFPAVAEAVARAAVATNVAVTVARLAGSATAATAANMPVFQRINHVVTATAYNYVFIWRDDKDLVFPDLATRQASGDTYFGGLEKQIAEACKTNDTERAGMLMRDYVDKWDNVYKVKRQMPGGSRRGI